ncbi:MAG: YhcH/YjgK/YiaL family protein [Ignavibacteria bacterium]|jgi:YhcH/YjgK/YiaL family protein|nr:YhcH/YjgK/YiaL family protein [Ignavibacteria bacterium]MDP3831791.1 YhcH/YjgK/YiaL family protein [Ignavibacteriaceae bacterium]
MVYDKIENAEKYYPLGSLIEKGLRYLQSTNFSKIEDGTYEIVGKHLFAIVSSYMTKNISDTVWESHKKYIDIQFMANGNEKMGHLNIQDAEITQKYNAEKDFVLYKPGNNYFDVKQNEFTIFFPWDVHSPGNLIQDTREVKKVVVKVKVD